MEAKEMYAIKKTRQPERFFKSIIGEYLRFCREKLNVTTDIDPRTTREMRLIVAKLRKRCEDAGCDWNKEVALKRFTAFLHYAYADNYVKDHWSTYEVHEFLKKLNESH